MVEWVKDSNVIAFNRQMSRPADALYIGEANQHVGAASKILSSPLSGARLPWKKTHPVFRFRPSEFTVWSGANYAGKSLMLGQVTLGLIRQGDKIAMLSLEMPPERTMARMLRQAAHNREPGEPFERLFEKWLSGKFFVYEKTTSISPKRTLEIIDYCANEIGANHVIIDSLMKCNVGANSYDQQRAFIEALFNSAKRHDNLHIHLVAHFGKPKPGMRVDRYSIKGPTEISDIADNVMLISRNLKKKREMEKPEEDRDEKVMALPDGTLTIDKQRNGEWDGEVGLWYDRESQQYLSGSNNKPMDFLAGYNPGDSEEAETERRAIQQESEE